MFKVYKLASLIFLLIILASCESTPFDRKPKDRIAKNGSSCDILISIYSDSTSIESLASIVFSEEDYTLFLSNPISVQKGKWSYKNNYAKIKLEKFEEFTVIDRNDKSETWRHKKGNLVTDWILTKSN